MKQRADEKSVFGDVSESVDALQRAIVVVSAGLRCRWYGVVANQSKTETAMQRVRLPFSKHRDGGKRLTI